MNVRGETQFDREDQLQSYGRACSASGVSIAASSTVVNRTHRVVRERARLMRDRRSYVRSLMLPLLLCSALLIITVLAVWSGVYQETGAADAVQDLSTSLISSENGFMLALFWFVPVTLAVLGTVWFARARNGSGNEMSR